MIVSLLQSLAKKFVVRRIGETVDLLLENRYFFRQLRHYLSDTKVQVELSHVDRYETGPTGEIDMELFREISEMSDSIAFDAFDNSQNILRVEGDNLPTPLEIRIEPMPTFEDGTQQIPRYEVVIKTYTDMVFGYRSNGPLDEFRTLSQDIAEKIEEECFDDTPKTTFLTGKIKGKLPTEDDRIEDDDIDMRAKVKGDKIQMTFKDPRNLTRGIQKYFKPL